MLEANSIKEERNIKRSRHIRSTSLNSSMIPSSVTPNCEEGIKELEIFVSPSAYKIQSLLKQNIDSGFTKNLNIDIFKEGEKEIKNSIIDLFSFQGVRVKEVDLNGINIKNFDLKLQRFRNNQLDVIEELNSEFESSNFNSENKRQSFLEQEANSKKEENSKFFDKTLDRDSYNHYKIKNTSDIKTENSLIPTVDLEKKIDTIIYKNETIKVNPNLENNLNKSTLKKNSQQKSKEVTQEKSDHFIDYLNRTFNKKIANNKVKKNIKKTSHMPNLKNKRLSTKEQKSITCISLSKITTKSKNILNGNSKNKISRISFNFKEKYHDQKSKSELEGENDEKYIYDIEEEEENLKFEKKIFYHLSSQNFPNKLSKIKKKIIIPDMDLKKTITKIDKQEVYRNKVPKEEKKVFKNQINFGKINTLKNFPSDHRRKNVNTLTPTLNTKKIHTQKDFFTNKKHNDIKYSFKEIFHPQNSNFKKIYENYSENKTLQALKDHPKKINSKLNPVSTKPAKTIKMDSSEKLEYPLPQLNLKSLNNLNTFSKKLQEKKLKIPKKGAKTKREGLKSIIIEKDTGKEKKTLFIDHYIENITKSFQSNNNIHNYHNNKIIRKSKKKHKNKNEQILFENTKNSLNLKIFFPRYSLNNLPYHSF